MKNILLTMMFAAWSISVPLLGRAQEGDTGTPTSDEEVSSEFALRPTHNASPSMFGARVAASAVIKDGSGLVASRTDDKGQFLLGPIVLEAASTRLRLPASLFDTDRGPGAAAATALDQPLDDTRLTIEDEHGALAWTFIGHADRDPGTGAERWFGVSTDEDNGFGSAVFVRLNDTVLGWYDTSDGTVTIVGPMNGGQRVISIRSKGPGCGRAIA